MKSHTGVCISLGIGCFYAKSTGPKINTTSSSQAELAAVAKGLQQAIYSSYFIEEQAHTRPVVIVNQDNKSTKNLSRTGALAQSSPDIYKLVFTG